MVFASARANWSASAWRLRHTPAVTIDGQKIELLANIEQPDDAPAAVKAGRWAWACSAANFFSWAKLATCRARKPSTRPTARRWMACRACPSPSAPSTWAPTSRWTRATKDSYLNPALGLRAIRWSLADPAMFRTQLRAVLRAAAHGKVKLLFPMLAHVSEITQTLAQVDLARAELDARGVAYGPVQLGR